MKLVLDSSVLIAASISRAGVCAELLADVLTQHELIASEFIINEVTRKLHDKFKFPMAECAEVRRFLSASATMVQPADIDPAVCRDSEDLPVLGTAVAGLADILVSVDKDLLTLGNFESFAIIKPGEFWKRAID